MQSASVVGSRRAIHTDEHGCAPSSSTGTAEARGRVQSCFLRQPGGWLRLLACRPLRSRPAMKFRR
jgi:hypothetical protein